MLIGVGKYRSRGFVILELVRCCQGRANRLHVELSARSVVGVGRSGTEGQEPVEPSTRWKSSAELVAQCARHIQSRCQGILILLRLWHLSVGASITRYSNCGAAIECRRVSWLHRQQVSG